MNQPINLRCSAICVLYASYVKPSICCLLCLVRSVVAVDLGAICVVVGIVRWCSCVLYVLYVEYRPCADTPPCEFLSDSIVHCTDTSSIYLHTLMYRRFYLLPSSSSFFIFLLVYPRFEQVDQTRRQPPMYRDAPPRRRVILDRRRGHYRYARGV